MFLFWIKSALISIEKICIYYNSENQKQYSTQDLTRALSASVGTALSLNLEQNENDVTNKRQM